MKQAKSANRDSLEEIDNEGALLHEFLESCDGHLVESTFNLTKPRGSVAAYVRPPTYERFFGEDQMSPRKDREEMATQWVIPSGAKACIY